MPGPTPVARMLNIHDIAVGIVTALRANATITSLVGTRIYPDDDVSGGAFPYLVYSTPSDVTQGWYSHAGVNDLWQITAVDKPPLPGGSTTNVVTLGAAIQTALLDTPWTIAGWATIAVTREGTKPYTEVVNGVVFRYVAVTVRVEAFKT